ncbi:MULTISPECIES: hypothetical protein [unclassified Bifidobacterium]|uniref:hypothetical protein n=1 Tax=unclassified Bifidobacterium TaxID=2608897 RepID=UPI00112E5012|nr:MULTISPECIES: hypothetical protein [unclassified Bifidobacterium]TPF91458.1 hypothetical protein BW10_00440 [Bifidobacterium sp. UTBIF-56]TPF91957.1 hypothetical protein BW14_10600 [Bifidobacterium sp. UTBIF-68]
MSRNNMETFAKISTRLWQNEKVRTLAMEHPSAFAVWTFAISYCAGELNDGELSRFHLKCLLGAADEDIDALIDAHLLDEHEDGTLWLHDFVEAQGRSRADVEAAKERKAEAGRQGGKASGESRAAKQPASKTKQTRSTSEADPKQNEADPKQNEEPAKQPASKTKPDTDTDTDTDTDKNSSNEEFSLPQTPSRGPGESLDGEYPLAFEQFWATYPRKEGKRKAFEAWKRARRKTNNALLIAHASLYQADPNRDPGYTLTPANWLDGEHWLDDPLPEKRRPGQPDPQAEKAARLRDVDWLCTHVDDPEAQDAALELPEKAQALARARYPDEWYRLWRRGMKRREQAKQEATP